ncbi:MAG: class I SAM-dependent methyltransferase [Methyloligellaceae bacterium]
MTSTITDTGTGPYTPMEQRTEAKFWDRIAEKYARRPVADEAAYQHKLRVTQDYFKPNMEVLEFGCGTGTTALAHAPFVKHIRATDISEKMIDIARRKQSEQNIDNITFEQTTIEDLDIPSESTDAVLAHSILHLLEDRDGVIGKVYDMLKPGGLFISSTACLSDGMSWFKPIARLGAYFGLIPKVYFFSRDDLKKSLDQSGFDIAYNWSPGPKKSLFLVARKRS